MSTSDLFSTHTNQPGYRLHYVELFNWGVFDKKVFRISPEGNTTLLTGANGAGKTTYLEAILTLLVPERKMRRYNQASGLTNKKDERSEESYVLGEIGEVENEAAIKEIVRLRPDKSSVYSVLLATFRSEERSITVAQVRWFVGSEMRRTYLVAREALTIAQHFYPFDAAGLWKKRLKKEFPRIGSREVIEDFDSPGKYASALRRHFGMRSEKALTLFSQTVGLKVLGNLDEFIRTNMLEESNVEDDFTRLREGFQTLLTAHSQILKAEAQLGLLLPIVEKDKEMKQLRATSAELDDLQQTTVPYFATQGKILLEQEIARQEAILQTDRQTLSEQKKDIDAQREEERELDNNIRNDEVGKRILNLDKEITEKTREKDKRTDKLKKYNTLARKINYKEDPANTLFDAQLLQAARLKTDLEQEENDAVRGSVQEEQLGKEIQKEYDAKAVELETLLQQKNNITGRVAEIRQELLTATGASEQEIPFVGELMQIRPEARKEWETAIEKVLHNFALQLIVPEKYYREVNRYVNSNNLKGRIVYQQFKEEKYGSLQMKDVQESLYSKIELNRKSDYADWLEYQLTNRFDYICTNDLETFRLSSRALTAAGLIKNDRRHEKDDRSSTFLRENFVLGWDNKEKIKLTRVLLKEIDGRIKDSTKRKSEYDKKKDRISKERDAVTAFLSYDKFDEINWKDLALAIQSLQTQRLELEKTNDRVNALKKQLFTLQQKIKTLETVRDELNRKIAKEEDKLESNQLLLMDCESALQLFAGIDLTERFTLFAHRYAAQLNEMRVVTIERVKTQILKLLRAELDKTNEQLSVVTLSLQRMMHAFKEPSEELRTAYPDWLADTHRLPSNIEYADEYTDLYKRISQDQLVEYKKRFKKYLNDDMIQRMTDFQTRLEIQEENIRENIHFLNQSLEGIDFRPNPSTFIKLDIKDNNTDRIRQFKLRLKSWKPNLGEYESTRNDAILEDSFKKIKSLINDLTENSDERKYITDVRNWLNFNAREIRREDQGVYKIYENTGKLSGGEKAQLTYTILGSAIAYQFGISQSGQNADSFRFICIDESFSNQDTEKANYLMELCRQLHLQLLCVTPEDKTNVVERYISSVHFVKRENNRNAVIFDLPITRFKEERAKYIQNLNE
ncbi:MAG: SbcC/MukB-like Walker B domain-containing protein [Tannerellaceae bacterium]